MKLNNKGMTTIEVLVTFVIVAAIVMGMYASISNLKEKHTLATYREELVKYKDLFIRDVQNDIITKGLASVNRNSDTSVVLNFKNGEAKEIVINKRSSSPDLSNATVCDTITVENSKDSISYGGIEYPLPDAGSDKLNINGQCMRVYSTNITSSTIQTDNNILVVKIGIFNPDLGDRYSINIVAPIDYE